MKCEICGKELEGNVFYAGAFIKDTSGREGFKSVNPKTLCQEDALILSRSILSDLKCWKMQKHKLAMDSKARAKQMWKQGMTYEQIAVQIGKSVSSVKKYLAEDIHRRTGSIVEMHDSGQSIEEIAEAVGLSKKAIYCILGTAQRNCTNAEAVKNKFLEHRLYE